MSPMQSRLTDSIELNMEDVMIIFYTLLPDWAYRRGIIFKVVLVRAHH